LSGRRNERYGSNFRLTELQSAIGRIQLQRQLEWTAARARDALLLAMSGCLWRGSWGRPVWCFWRIPP
jgi:hypothetical protein